MAMSWWGYALLSAFCLATADALCKKALEDTDELLVAWARVGFSVPFLIVANLPIAIPLLDRTFWQALVIALPLEITAFLLYIRAIKVSPLSLTVPYLALTPVFLIVSSFVILGELPDKSGVAGILLISLGAYVLNVRAGAGGLLAPVRRVLRERGSLLMIGVAFVYSITSSLGRVMVLHSSALFLGLVYTSVLTVVLAPFALMRLKGQGFRSRGKSKSFLLIGLFYALMVIFHYQALAHAEVAYMIAVKRTSLVFSVFYGAVVFKERSLWERLGGSVLMLLGVGLITLC
jgi:drug/metabolite transporter (DMT)-like permease